MIGMNKNGCLRFVKMFSLIFTVSFFLVFLPSCRDSSLPYQNTDLSFEERAKDLVSRMTLEEKVSQMLHEASAIERLGVPEYNWWNECLHGVGRAGLATVFPQAIGMSAMWDDEQMFRIATAISDEARAKHHNYISQNRRGYYQGLTFWTPNINIFRDPRWGRGMETYGEDPYLAGELAVDFIKGLQGNDEKYLKLVATAKHFVVHSGPESSRHKFNAVPSDYDLYETYLPHFKKVVQEADVYSVMCAYNRLNDQPCCGSQYVDSLLRIDWGFKGYMVSDCWAVRDFFNPGDHEVVATVVEASAKAVKGGTDLNCGNSYGALVDAVKQGLITEAEIDRSVTRLMLARMKLGMFDPPASVPFSSIPYSVVDSKEHQELALESARKSMVLLKNQNKILPFSKSVNKVAVIGPNANNKEVLLANYNGFPTNPKTPFAGICDKLPNSEVTFALGSSWAEGIPYLETIEKQYLYTDSTLSQNGLMATYYNNSEFEGNPAYSGVDDQIDFIWWTNEPQPGISNDTFSVHWSGVLVPPVSGYYYLGGDGFSGYSVYLSDSILVSNEHIHHSGVQCQKVYLEKDSCYQLSFDYKQNKSTYPMARLQWEVPGRNLKKEAVDLAAGSDVVVLCMGLSALLEGEEMDVDIPGFLGGDRTDISLPSVQTELIKAVMALGKPTVLVLLNGSSLAFNWEAENVPAILEAWYPGQAGGTAIADILFGDYNPSGRLPVTFYRDVTQLPSFEDYSMMGRTYKYFQGKPLYEFGFGLSYSSFEYTNLQVKETVMADETFEVSVEVTNTGDRDGDEVLQLYLSFPEKENAPLHTLQGFKRVFLKSNETRTVKFVLKPEQLALYHPDYHKAVYAGVVNVFVGGKQPDNKAIAEGQVVKGQFTVQGDAVNW